MGLNNIKWIPNAGEVFKKAHSVKLGGITLVFLGLSQILPNLSPQNPEYVNYPIYAAIVSLILAGIVRFIDQDLNDDKTKETGGTNSGRNLNS